MNNDLISVIVCAYNIEKYLGECIESVLRQTYRNIELIIVNDGSTDNTASIINSYKAVDNRIISVDIENSGPSIAKNTGLDIAKGSYITFLDSDDVYLTDDYLEKLYDSLIEYDADQSLCYMIKFLDGNLELLRNILMESDIDESSCYKVESQDVYRLELIKFGIKEKVVSGRDVLLEKLRYFPVGNTLTYLFKKKDFDNIRFPEGLLMEDNAIIHRLIYKSKKIAVVNKAMYGYRVRDNSLTRSPTPYKYYIGGYYTYNDRIEFYKENNDQQLLEHAIRDKSNFLFKQYIESIRTNTVDKIPEEIRMTSDELVQEYLKRGFHVE